MISPPRFPIGTVFKTRGKHPRTCTVVDILRTFNAAEELVSVRYVAVHPGPIGGVITDREVVDATIAIGLISVPETTAQ